MKTVTINFTDGDVIVLECVDMVINNGFLTLFMRPEQHDETTLKTVQAYNVATVDSWTFEQTDAKEEEA